MRPLRRLLSILVSSVLLVPVAGMFATGASAQTGGSAGPEFRHLIGSLHEHSGYSDGFPGSRPSDYYESGKSFGLDFLAGSEHSDNLGLPVTLSEECLPPEGSPSDCAIADDEQPENSVTKWEAARQQAVAATTRPEDASDNSYTAFRGFEWTTDRFGHINVYLSKNFTNAKIDGGYATMETFWKWFTTSPVLGGGGDGLATFNHPSDKSLNAADPGFNWNDFDYRPEADRRMVGVELYNDHNDDYEDEYQRALERGWHVGAIGAEDLGHRPADGDGEPDANGVTDDWGGDKWAKTVFIARENTVRGLREALLARRFYAVQDEDLRIQMSADGQPMGSRLVRAPGETVEITVKANDPAVTVELVTNGVAAQTSGSGNEASYAALAGADEDYFYFRVMKGADPVGYTSPVWIRARDAGDTDGGRWLAGDLHVHSTYSHDSYGGPSDDNTGPDEFYIAGLTVEQQFAVAEARGLDFLAITDHNDVRSQSDSGFGTDSVIGIPGYENSLNGHAQMLGATKVYDNGDKNTEAVQQLAAQLRADGGAFQINHPREGALEDEPDWKYGFDVVPDTVEVWNISRLFQPPAPSASNNDAAIRYWEGFLDQGFKVGATGGSDSHWASTTAIQGPGSPTTWVFSDDNSRAGVLEGLREGRTFITMQYPAQQAPLLFVEADEDGNGTYESMIGDTVESGSALRARVEGAPGSFLRVVTNNGTTVFENEPVTGPSFARTFTLPEDSTWVRAEIYQPDAKAERDATCDEVIGSGTTYCKNDLAILAMTSALYLDNTPEPTALDLSAPGSGQYSDSVDASVTLTSGGAPVGDAAINFELGSRSASATTDENGVATMTLPLDLAPGSYELIARYAGGGDLLPSGDSSSLTITREGTGLEYTGQRSTSSKIIQLAARLSEDDGPALAGQTITFAMNGQTITAVTDSSGVAQAAAESPKPGRAATVTISYTGSELYDASSTTTTVSRSKPSTIAAQPRARTTSSNESRSPSFALIALGMFGAPASFIGGLALLRRRFAR
jgi:hypothetical protein